MSVTLDVLCESYINHNYRYYTMVCIVTMTSVVSELDAMKTFKTIVLFAVAGHKLYERRNWWNDRSDIVCGHLRNRCVFVDMCKQLDQTWLGWTISDCECNSYWLCGYEWDHVLYLVSSRYLLMNCWFIVIVSLMIIIVIKLNTDIT